MTAEEQIFFNALVEWDGTTDIDNPKQLTIYKVGGEELFNLCKIYSKAYKSALRKAIGERIKELEDSLDNLPPHLAQNRRIQIYELKSIRDSLMDDDPFHSVTTERSAEDWKRMHDRVYEMAIETEAKLKERDQEIEKLKFSDNAGNERIQELHRQLKERDELLELMAEKASHLVHLHGCEQEGLMSGKPTFQQWVNAVGSLQEVLTRYSNLKAK